MTAPTLAQPKPPQVQPLPPTVPTQIKPQSSPVPRPQRTETGDEGVDDGSGEPAAEKPTPIEDNANPLTRAGDRLDTLIEMRVNDNLWNSMQGGLPCLDTSVACIHQLQEKAIADSLTLKQIDERVQNINQKIDEARARNEKTVKLGVLKPVVQYYVKDEAVTETVNGQTRTRNRGFLQKVFGFLTAPISSINTIISLIGIPLLEGITQSNENAQARAIAISDLQVKVAQIEQERAKIADALREQVVLQVIDFDTIRREFQVSQELVKRERLRTRLVEVEYRFDGSDTVAFLGNLSSLDQQKAETFKAWAKVRSQLARIK